MRLGQLSRKLNITINDIVAYLADKGIEINPHPNSKLEEAIENEVIATFSIEDVSEGLIVQEESIVEDVLPEVAQKSDESKEVDSTQEPELLPEAEEPEKEVEESQAQAQQNQEQLNQAEQELEEFKAEKIRLEGLKVLGKIELPEPKAPKEDKEEEDAEDPSEDEDNGGVNVVRHSRQNSRPRLTPEQREERRLKNKRAKEKRLQKERQRKKELELLRKKEKKEKHYLNKINNPSPYPKKVKSKKTVRKRAQETQSKQPKTLMGKFWKWLNT